ncbi:DNA cytosine methyltransferase [Butyricicoccus sp. Marseille-Q5471]|uniref:DNA cytosine methyltransferase n=1 Tax=Butyricicoccus sp. Marseille-Q5471 TaxID=3039493 RepID=UPI0024BD1DA7|nr:DNA cytosine methyltransferase [Butyricicoccus sp. Marseille-Q5471]
MFDEIIVDGFCGGGGMSTGIEIATGTPVDIGINHDAAAIAQHRANHPRTEHYNESIFDVDPKKTVRGRSVGWAHFSPDCTHFSVAKGGTPVKKSIRGLAWVVARWAGTVKARIISMENVPEFMTWGPLVAKRDKATGRVLKLDGTLAAPGERVPVQEQQLVPDKKRSGKTFRQFISAMRGMGYEAEWNVLTACDYGAPTTRRRLFILFRRDGKRIVWPEATHGDPKSEAVQEGRLLPWRTAAECIEWDRPCQSIFERKKPLAENTMRRIARGIQKFIVDNPEPFIVSIGQTSAQDRSRGISEPLRTVVSKNESCLVTPLVVQVNHTGEQFRGQTVEEPLPTLTAKNGFGVVAPCLIQYHSETGNADVRGQECDAPIMTIDTSPRYGLAAASMIEVGYGERTGQLPRVCDLEKPLGTVVSTQKHAVVSAFISKYKGCDIGQPADAPLQTITAGGRHFAEVRAFLIKYYGQGVGQSANVPLDTITTKDRFGVIEVLGSKYQIVDIGMRMLEPRELYNAQGFPPDYIIDRDDMGKPYPKYEQVRKVGNSVPPPFGTALVRANWPERCIAEIRTMAELEEVMAG